MAVVLKTEKKNLSTLVLYTTLYTVLCLGALTMVYPFLLMVSGSVKSRVDVTDMDIIPRFLYDDDLLFRKVSESKYNEDLQLYLRASRDGSRNFRSIEPPSYKKTLVDDWEAFLQGNELPLGWVMTGYGPTLEGKIVQKNELAFRNHLKAICNDDIETFRNRFDEPIENWFYLKFRPERLTDRKYQVSSTRMMAEFYDFKKTLPLEDRIVVSCQAEFQRFVSLISGGGEQPNVVLSSQPQTGHWESYVREALHPQFIRVDASALGAWQTFLEKKYGQISDLNKLYGTSHSSFAQCDFPENRLTASALLTDYILFISNPNQCPLSALRVETPEIMWGTFLKRKYSDLAMVSTAHGRSYDSFEAIHMPQKAFDHHEMLKDTWSVRKAYLLQNFAMVIDYIYTYGYGIQNTIVYCLLSIALSLLVNPLAAYALSRYRLPSQYKILLFLIATMAFPAVVTMIPNFLLLRDLGLLNTFSALLLPSMANGYSIFLLKGFFDSLPKELFEAAEIDGANEWTKFWMLTMNLSKPILAVIALGAFNGAYSNFMFAFILCQDKDMWTLMVWLYQLQQFSSQGVVFASLLVAAIPTLLIYIVCQNVIIRGIVVPTEK
jgi:multiple sugar transport system permease protein